mgnify:CR=1 FL=1
MWGGGEEEEISDFFLGPKGYIEGGGEVSEFFQVPKPLWRGLSPEHI